MTLFLIGIARLDKNLTSFRFLPFGFWLAPKSLNRPLFASLSGRFSRTHFVSSHLGIFRYKKKTTLVGGSLFIGIARLDKNLTSFRFLPFGFWLAPKSLNRPLFASLSGRFSRTHFVSSHLASVQNKTKKTPLRVSFCFIGIARFELTTSCSRSKRSTRLSYIPVTRTIIVKSYRFLKGSLPKNLKKFGYFFFFAA